MSNVASNPIVESQVEPGYIEEPTLVWKIQSSEMRKPCFHTEASLCCTIACELGAACRRPIAEWLRYR